MNGHMQNLTNYQLKYDSNETKLIVPGLRVRIPLDGDSTASQIDGTLTTNGTAQLERSAAVLRLKSR